MATERAARRDHATEHYFDHHVPEYSAERLAFAARTLRELAPEQATLVDLGCGAGNTLAFLREQVPLGDCLAVDVSPNLLARAREATGCETFEGSLMDPALPERIGRRFDVAVIAAVLHHLIGATRAESRALARGAVDIALRLLHPGGLLVVVEPVYYPPLAMDALFYVKKLFTRLSSGRIGLGDYWWNIGAPVVSYYTNEELQEMVTAGGRAELVARDIDPAPLGRLGALLSKTNTTLVVRKRDDLAA
jgi:SAM-dependent methyltransferase